MERPTGMRNRLVALSAVLAFAVAVAAVAVVAGKGGDGDGGLEKLSFAFAGGGAERSSMALGGPVAYPHFGPLEYKVRGDLPELGGEAPAYRLGEETSEAKVTELASRLGLDGDVETSANGWTVRDDEMELSVLRVPGVPWYLSRTCGEAPGVEATPTSSGAGDGVVSSSGCAYGGVGMARGRSSASSPALPTAEPRRVAVAPAPPPPASALVCPKNTMECSPATEAPVREAPTTSAPPCPPGASCAYDEAISPPSEPSSSPFPPTTVPSERPTDLPTKAEAERLARSFFTDLGVGLDGFELRDGFIEWHAVVESRIAELPAVGWAHSVSLGPKGRIVAANGFLAEPDRIGDYPLVTTARGLERLKSGEGVGPRPLGGGMEGGWTSTDIDCTKPTVICDPPVPVTTIPGSEPSRSTTTTMAFQPPTSAMARPANRAPTPMTTLACPPNAECSAPTAPGLPPPPPRAPAPVPPPPIRPPVLTITGVHLALQHVGAALVPVYVFELEGGGETFPVPAVTEEWIEENRQAGPEDGPAGDRRVSPAPMPMPAPVPMPTVVTTVPVPPAGAEPGSAPTQVEEVPASRP